MKTEHNLTAKYPRAYLLSRPPPPYEMFDAQRRPNRLAFRAKVDSCLKGRWLFEGTDLPSLHPPIDWAHGTRSNRAHIHAWDPLSCLFSVFSETRERQYFEVAFNYAVNWVRTFAAVLAEDSGNSSSQTGEESFIRYDMAVGLRSYRLAYLIDEAARFEDIADAVLDPLYACLLDHLELLSRPKFFSAHSNHGLYQALGLSAAARRFGRLEPFLTYRAVGADLVARAVAGQFFADGIHREHSPGYQLMILQTMLGAREAGLLEDLQDVSKVISAAEEALGWMITPNRQIATFGDSDVLPLAPLGAGDCFRNPALKYLLSDGRTGEAPVSGVKSYLESGYAFARIYASDVRDASYLAHAAAFHSRVHKHADHLTFVWSEGSTPILIDPGRFAYSGRTIRGSDLHKQGFWYGDPKRVYVESTRAHNCVEIDGNNYPRMGVPPFGSGLRYVGLDRGFVVFHSEIVHPENIRHSRKLVFSPGAFLLVVDELKDESGAPHEFRQWF